MLPVSLAQQSLAQAAADPHLACDTAAAKAERQWNLPTGLLAAIGSVETGRLDTSGLHLRAWPWSINADGWGYFAANKTEAMRVVRSLQARGAHFIDVGCFQVDLAYHPYAFASLDEAFDPDMNAGAASRILSLGRFGAAGWNQAVAAYHSASLLRGGWYLQRVLSAWPAARARVALLALSPGQPPGYIALLSPQARLVRVITPVDPAPASMAGLPRVVSPADAPPEPPPTDARLQLPRVLTPPIATRGRRL